MCHTPGKLPDGLHFLALSQRMLKPSMLADVEDIEHEPCALIRRQKTSRIDLDDTIRLPLDAGLKTAWQAGLGLYGAVFEQAVKG